MVFFLSILLIINILIITTISCLIFIIVNLLFWPFFFFLCRLISLSSRLSGLSVRVLLLEKKRVCQQLTGFHSFVFIMPLAGVFFGVLLLDEPVTIYLIASISSIVTGIIVVNMKSKNEH